MRAYIYAAAILALATQTALASPPVVAAAGALSGSSSGAAAFSGSTAEAVGTGVGIAEGGGAESSSEGSITNRSGDSRALGVAVGQAPTAVSGICGKGNKFGFGALEWTDFSSKCFNYMIALEAAKQGNWTLTNQWVERADQM